MLNLQLALPYLSPKKLS